MKALITNPYLLAVNQNDLGCQAYVAQRDGEAYVLVKDALVRFGTSRYVALYNGMDDQREVTVRAETLDLSGRIAAFDLVELGDDPKKRLFKNIYWPGCNLGIGHEPDHGITTVDIPKSELPAGKKLTIAVRPVSSLGTKGKTIGTTWRV